MFSHDFAHIITIHTKVEAEVVALLLLLPAVIIGNDFKFTMAAECRALAFRAWELSPTTCLAAVQLRFASISKHKSPNIHNKPTALCRHNQRTGLQYLERFAEEGIPFFQLQLLGQEIATAIVPNASTIADVGNPFSSAWTRTVSSSSIG